MLVCSILHTSIVAEDFLQQNLRLNPDEIAEGKHPSEIVFKENISRDRSHGARIENLRDI